MWASSLLAFCKQTNLLSIRIRRSKWVRGEEGYLAYLLDRGASGRCVKGVHPHGMRGGLVTVVTAWRPDHRKTNQLVDRGQQVVLIIERNPTPPPRTSE